MLLLSMEVQQVLQLFWETMAQWCSLKMPHATFKTLCAMLMDCTVPCQTSPGHTLYHAVPSKPYHIPCLRLKKKWSCFRFADRPIKFDAKSFFSASEQKNFFYLHVPTCVLRGPKNINHRLTASPTSCRKDEKWTFWYVLCHLFDRTTTSDSFLSCFHSLPI